MRIMGLDFGSKTVGVAISDPLFLTAQGIEIVRRKAPGKLRQTLARINELKEEYEVGKIVLGFPKNMNNTEGERCEKTLEFKEMLGMLNESYRIILILYYVEGFRIADIASILNVNENTVKTRLARARVQLKQEYAPVEENDRKKVQYMPGSKMTNQPGKENKGNTHGILGKNPVSAGSMTASVRKG